MMSTSDVLDLREEASVCATAMLSLGRNRAAAGKIRTARCFEDNGLLKAALAERSEGEVLVVDGGGSLRTALIGDRLAGIDLANGWAGTIVFGSIRDSAAIDVLAFHVKALGTNPRKSSNTGAGELDVVIECGGVRFVPGWYLYSDADGVVVIADPLD